MALFLPNDIESAMWVPYVTSSVFHRNSLRIRRHFKSPLPAITQESESETKLMHISTDCLIFLSSSGVLILGLFSRKLKKKKKEKEKNDFSK